MRTFLALATAALVWSGCNQSGEDRGAYSKQVGGSMEGAGGAGRGYDGTGNGRGKDGLVPDSGAARTEGNGQTNNSVPNPTREKGAQS